MGHERQKVGWGCTKETELGVWKKENGIRKHWSLGMVEAKGVSDHDDY